MRALNLTVLFDLDGTLTDSRQGIVRCFEYALCSLGYSPPPPAELLWYIGPPLGNSFARLLNTTNRALIDRAITLYRERYSQIGLFENELYAQVPVVLHQIRAEGYRTYVATSKAQVYAQKIIEYFDLSELFDRVYGSELDGKHSVKGELIQHILTTEQLSPDRTVMVGDRADDTLGAKQNGLYSIGVSYGYGSIAELTEAGTDTIVDRPAQLLPLLQQFFPAPHS